jgi:hypothetical protein
MCLYSTIFLDNKEYTLADLNSLGIIILEIINEIRETLESTAVDWSAEAVNFIKATSFIILDELLDVSFPNL